MSQPGKPSTAHVFIHNQCIYCGTHKVNVERLNLECTRERENLADQAVKSGKS